MVEVGFGGCFWLLEQAHTLFVFEYLPSHCRYLGCPIPHANVSRCGTLGGNNNDNIVNNKNGDKKYKWSN